MAEDEEKDEEEAAVKDEEEGDNSERGEKTDFEAEETVEVIEKVVGYA